jgi:hypothetical protein
MAAEHRDRSYKVGRDYPGQIDKNVSNNGTVWHSGYVRTEHGIVVVIYSEPDGTCLDFIHAGRLHIRQFDKQFQPSYLVTLAKRFASDIVAQAE